MTGALTDAFADGFARERDPGGRLVALRLDHGLEARTADGPVWLVAFDGSEDACRALAEAIRWAAGYPDGGLRVVNVQPWMAREAAEAGLPGLGLEATAGATAMLESSGLPWCLHIVMGDIIDRLVSLSQALGCSGIVVGHRGMGAIESALVGSVVHRLLGESPLPVLVVP